MDPIYLTPTSIIDSDHSSIMAYASTITASAGDDPVKKAVALFYAVRDNIRYDPYTPFYLPEHYRASNILKNGRGFCVCKASLLCALGRAAGVPTRVGFADVRNHLATRQLVELMGSDLFVYHGFNEFYLNDKWVKATPTFNTELCNRHHVPPIEFNGLEDAIFHAFNLENKKHMEYLTYHGSYADIPIDTILSAWHAVYGKERVEFWKYFFQELSRSRTGNAGKPDFYTEDVIH